MTFELGVVPGCLNCGAIIGPNMFPHYCLYCMSFLQSHGCLPCGLLDQVKLGEQ